MEHRKQGVEALRSTVLGARGISTDDKVQCEDNYGSGYAENTQNASQRRRGRN